VTGDVAESVLVVAHPDDEALWFSSIVGRVRRVIIAYEACAELPELGARRRPDHVQVSMLEGSFDCDRTLAAKLKAVYEKHACWTWSPEYELPLHESFLGESASARTWADALPLTCLMLT
jgi:hypothetical protein